MEKGKTSNKQSKSRAAKNDHSYKEIPAQLDTVVLNRQLKEVQNALSQSNKNHDKNDRPKNSEIENIIDELKKTKSYLLQALRIANLGIWEWDIISDEITWSDETYRIFGVENDQPDHLTYKYFLSFIHKDDLEFVKQSVEESLSRKGVYSLEHRIIRPNGNERIVKQRAEMVYNAADQLVRMVGTIQDVTDDRKKEQRLHEQDIELKSKTELLDLAHDTIIMHDLDGNITFWNRGAENTYGWKRKEVLGKVTHEVLKTKFSEPLMKIISSLSTNGNWEGELIQTAKDKTKITVESKWALQNDEHGKPARILEIDRDITDRKHAHKQAEEALQYAENIIETIDEAIAVLDSKLHVVSVNKTFCDFFHTTVEDVKDRHIYQMEEGSWNSPEFKRLLGKILPENKNINNYEVAYSSDQGRIHLILNAKQLSSKSNDEKKILLAFHDITYRKQQEKDLQDLTEELLLAEEKQRQQVATALHDSIGQMLAFSKRELTAMAKENNLSDNPRLNKIQQFINESIKESRELTADLSSPTLHTFGLEAATEELAEQILRANGFKYNISSTNEPKPLEKKVELLMYRSAKELFNNIVKHSNAENIDIDIKSSDNFLELTVSDDGDGFNTDNLNYNNNKKKSYGLFSIDQRLKNVGGSFNIESQKGNGTKVMLKAPMNFQNGQGE